jgi:hypothetical protein
MKILLDRQIYTDFTEPYLLKASRLVWIATANIKATFVRSGNNFLSFPDMMASLIGIGVQFRIIHSEI